MEWRRERDAVPPTPDHPISFVLGFRYPKVFPSLPFAFLLHALHSQNGLSFAVELRASARRLPGRGTLTPVRGFVNWVPEA